MKVKLRKEIKKHNLCQNTVYEVIGIEANDFRIVDNENKPYLYRPLLFKIINKNEPDFWITEYGDEGERYSYPIKINKPGFFENLFNDDIRAKQTFENVLKSYYPVTYLKYSEVKKVLHYFRKYHVNLFTLNPWYEFQLIRIGIKSIDLKITFKKGQKYCCIEPHCHLMDINWTKLDIDRIMVVNIMFNCEKGSLINIDGKYFKNNLQSYSVRYSRNKSNEKGR
jgi:hypothetical protein